MCGCCRFPQRYHCPLRVWVQIQELLNALVLSGGPTQSGAATMRILVAHAPIWPKTFHLMGGAMPRKAIAEIAPSAIPVVAAIDAQQSLKIVHLVASIARCQIFKRKHFAMHVWPPHNCIAISIAGRATLLRLVGNVTSKFLVWNVLQVKSYSRATRRGP